ncbi:hypothetical protein I317_01510 [Kwoniella heveanensis CBS 569]|nr:hypothetical protein I317_01510 [Kwoniella heveanensis CBS 569]
MSCQMRGVAGGIDVGRRNTDEGGDDAPPPRRHRAGLGLPPAVIIRSAPGPSTAQPRLYDQADVDSPYPHVIANAEAGPGPSSRLYEPPQNYWIPRETVWREWNTNPALHGPSRVKVPPTFVASSNVYDELGRTVDDGVGVVVDQGIGNGKGKEGDESGQKDDGEGVRGWYLSLSMDRSGSGETTLRDEIGDTSGASVGLRRKGAAQRSTGAKDAAGSSGSSSGGPRSAPVADVIDLTGDGDDDEDPSEVQASEYAQDPVQMTDNPASTCDEEKDIDLLTYRSHPNSALANNNPSSQPNTRPTGQVSVPSTSPATPPAPAISNPVTHAHPPLRIHSNEWFIRRALLRQSLPSDSTPSGSYTRPDGTSRPKTKTYSSIGDMLNMPASFASKKRVFEPQYALGPDNKGYSLLKDKLGWAGGGLGRPVEWGNNEAPSSRLRQETTQDYKSAQEGLDNPDEAEVRTLEGAVALSEPKEMDPNGHPVVDLTISDSDADTDSDSNLDDQDQDPDPSKYGPGRTAPISTTLKLDRLGLGHRRSRPNPNHSISSGSKAKKITHSHQDIQDAQRRAKYGTGRGHGTGLELGKKGKIKWKERDKREREDRRRLAAALNA